MEKETKSNYVDARTPEERANEPTFTVSVSGEPVPAHIQLDKLLVGTTEQIVILYANHSGRESDNRAQFRRDVEEVLRRAFKHVREL